MAKNKKIILITIDSLRYDYIKYLGLDKFLGDCIRFENCYAAGVPTHFSFPSIFQSIFPSHTMETICLKNEVPTFVEKLRENNFITAGFVGSNAFCSSLLGYDRGFDYFENYLFDKSNIQHRKIKKYIPRKLKMFIKIFMHIFNSKYLYTEKYSREIIENSLKFLQNNKDSNIFLWMHFMDVHFPYATSNCYNPYKNFSNGIIILKAYNHLERRSLTSDSKSSQISKASLHMLNKQYIESIILLGNRLQLFFESLPGKLKDYVVIITSDHGEEFGERGSIFHASNLHEEIVHVPLIINLKSKSVNAKKLCSLIDLPVTILSLAGIQTPSFYLGIDITKQPNRKYVISEGLSYGSSHFGSHLEDVIKFKLKSQDWIYSLRSVNHSLIGAGKHISFFNRNKDIAECEKLPFNDPEFVKLNNELQNHINFCSDEC